jgi:zinc D-Ala-D-Ala dipeptidase
VKTLFFDVRSIIFRLIVSRTRHLPRVLVIGVLFWSFSYVNTIGSALAVSLGLRSAIPEISTCRQLILVTTASWADVSATVRLYQRDVRGKVSWRKVGQPFQAVVGRRGLGWGIGLHGTGEVGAPRKREGDRKAPAGVFRLSTVFGIASPGQVSFLRLPYQQVTAMTVAVDDPGSRYYNRIVDQSAVSQPDWSSAESMLQVGDRYRFGVMIEHNRQPFPGYGSCIFLHIWSRDHSGTAGCTAVDQADLKRLLRWLDVEKNPLIVQLPVPEYLRLKQDWGLP